MTGPTGPAETQPTIEDVVADFVSASIAPLRPHAERVLRELSGIDHAVYEAIASTPSPTLDEPLRHLSNAANRSALWLAVAAGLAVLGGRGGRRAALAGVVSIGVSSALVNLGLKSLYARSRPDRIGAGVVVGRQARMPASSSFPSGHSASGFAFAAAVGRDIPWLTFPLSTLAAAVAYSRVHTGVHYPGDALAGVLAGSTMGVVVGRALERRFPPRP